MSPLLEKKARIFLTPIKSVCFILTISGPLILIVTGGYITNLHFLLDIRFSWPGHACKPLRHLSSCVNVLDAIRYFKIKALCSCLIGSSMSPILRWMLLMRHITVHVLTLGLQSESQCPGEKTDQAGEKCDLRCHSSPPCDPILHNVLVLQDIFTGNWWSLVTVPTENAPVIKNMLLWLLW